MLLMETFIQTDEELEFKRRKSIWSKASYQTRKGVKFVFNAMINPKRWERAEAYAEKLRSQLEERKGPKVDQDLIEIFLMNFYRFWNIERTKATRLMISTAKKKFEGLPKEEQDAIKEKAGDTNSYIDAMQIPIILTPELEQMIKQINLLTDGLELDPNYKPKFIEAGDETDSPS